MELQTSSLMSSPTEYLFLPLYITLSNLVTQRLIRSLMDGTDAAQKLILLAREAFDVELAFDSIRRVGIDESTGESSKTIRVVAQCRRTKDGFEASVTPVELSQDHPLADVRGASNRLLVEDGNRRTWTVSGRGAGRWPTTEAVIADLFDLSGASTATTLEEEEECVA